MKTIKATIIDPVGLHARPASLLVKEASKFDSEITVKAKGNSGNLKSIMNVMALGVKQNEQVEIEISGSDENEAYEAIQKTLKENKLV